MTQTVTQVGPPLPPVTVTAAGATSTKTVTVKGPVQTVTKNVGVKSAKKVVNKKKVKKAKKAKHCHGGYKLYHGRCVPAAYGKG